MRARRLLMGALMAGTALLAVAGGAGAGTAAADEGDAEPTEAGTTFRSATAIEQGQTARAAASTGDYLYWVFPAGAGQVPTVKTTVTLPQSAARSGSSDWQLDVYDGLQRRQACAGGTQTKRVSQEAASVTLSCRLRTVQPWAETWSNDPLPGAYYVRLTAVRLPERDLGLPVEAEVEVDASGADGSRMGGGELAAPLLPAVRAGAVDANADADADEDAGEEGDEAAEARTVTLAEPESGWMGGWWSDRWIWTAGGGVLGALAAVGGYNLARRR